MKKTFLNFLILFIWLFIYNNTNAYTSSDHIEIKFKTSSDWTEIYSVPAWKDLIIYKIQSKNNSSNLKLRDNWGDIKEDFNYDKWISEVEFTFLDNLEVRWWNYSDVFTVFWYLVSEDEDIQYYIQWDSNAWNKHIFNKEDIDFIYFREFIFFIFLMVIKFFEFIIWRKLLMK